MASLTAAVPRRFRDVDRVPVVAVAALPALLALTRLLPAEGPGLALRLACAGACVLLLPGGLLLRAFVWPAEPALAVTASFVLSLAIAFVAFAATFALNASLSATIAVIAAAALVAAFVAAVRPRAAREGAARTVFYAVVGAAVVFAGLVWWTAVEVGTGDVLFHLARARKLADADTLTSVAVANEFRDGGLHPGYAFPLWHGLLAVIATLAGVDVALVTLHLSALLVPIAFLAAYAAGTALFGSRWGGVAALAFQVAQLGLSRDATGSFPSLSLPSSLTRVLLFPALLALVFAYLRERDRRLLVPLAASALAIAVVHPTYLIFAAIVLAGFAVVWVAIAEDRKALLAPIGLAAAAILVPAVIFFVWLLPIVTTTASHQPSAGEKARAIAHYGEQLQTVGDLYRAAPDAITRAGPVVVAGFAVVPLLAFGLARRRGWAAFGVGGTLLVLAFLLIPEVFSRFSDLVSISQSRRLSQFLPIPFALAGAAVLCGLLRAVGVVAALLAGVALELAYEAELTHTVERAGPYWPIWLAVVGTPLALAVAFVLRRRGRLPDPIVTGWAVVVSLAFVVPIAVGGFVDLDRRDKPDPRALTPGLVAELRSLDRDDVVFGPVQTSYRVAAYAPVYVVANPPHNVADTEANRPYRRVRDVTRFFSTGATEDERRRTLDSYEADWLLVDKTSPYPTEFVARFERAYEDDRYVLYRVAPA